MRQVEPPRGAGRGSRRDKLKIATATLAACEAGVYTNSKGERVELADAIASAKERTVMFELAAYPRRRHDQEANGPRAATTITVTEESTNEAIVRLAPTAGHLGCLNFASAKNPGGGFLNGAQAQEESLARSSALYPCLIEEPDHYARNRAYRSPLYLDLAIFSPDVPFFRTDEGEWLDAPVACSVITCAAPNAKGHATVDELESTLRRRAAFVLRIARDEGIDTLILGAWGAGAFGNDPEIVARIFRDHLYGELRDAFREVTFAIYGVRENLDAFLKQFAKR